MALFPIPEDSDVPVPFDQWSRDLAARGRDVAPLTKNSLQTNLRAEAPLNIIMEVRVPVLKNGLAGIEPPLGLGDLPGKALKGPATLCELLVNGFREALELLRLELFA